MASEREEGVFRPELGAKSGEGLELASVLRGFRVSSERIGRRAPSLLSDPSPLHPSFSEYLPFPTKWLQGSSELSYRMGKAKE